MFNFCILYQDRIFCVVTICIEFLIRISDKHNVYW